MSALLYDPIAVARQFLFVREHGGQNKGVWVNCIQKITGNGDGDSWCASFVSLVLGVAYGGQSPLPRTASCDVLLEAARDQGWLTDTPSESDLYLFLNNPTDAHHVGFVVSVDPLIGIAGNTSSDGHSSNGDGVYEHEIPDTPGKITFIHYPR